MFISKSPLAQAHLQKSTSQQLYHHAYSALINAVTVTAGRIHDYGNDSVSWLGSDTEQWSGDSG